MDKILIAPSTDPCPLNNIQQYIKELEQSGADWLHCDIMDGAFVEKTTYDNTIFSLIAKRTNLVLDVHLMVENPQDKIASYIEAGANIVTIHYESVNSEQELLSIIQQIHEYGAKVGLSIKPQTDVEVIYKYLTMIDLCLVMSVEPGKSGQSFIPASLDKIRDLNNYKNSNKLSFLIEVDGGVNLNNSKDIINAGANILVSGSCIYNAIDKKDTINKLKEY